MSQRKFNTPIFFTQKFAKVDEENGILYDVVICEEGEAKGHGTRLDKQFISDVVKFGNEYKDAGVKCRFGHPNMCSDALGTYLGRYKNFRLIKGETDKALADLYLDKSAKITPNGDLYEYVITLAKTSPDHFGNSIVFETGESRFEEKTNELGETEKFEYSTIIKLWESDLVDSPAATNSLFSSLSGGELAYQVTTFLDSNPQIFSAIESNPEIIKEFFNKYKLYKDLKMNQSEEIKKELGIIDTMIAGIKKLFTAEPEPVVEPVVEPVQLAEMITCPYCEKEFDVTGLEVDAEGYVICPECGKKVNKANPIKEEEPVAEVDGLKAEIVEKDKQLSEKDLLIETLKAEHDKQLLSIQKKLEAFKTRLASIESNGKTPVKKEQFEKPNTSKKASFDEVLERRSKKNSK